ncbi:MAG: P-loop NTPase [Haloferacaceae archaeon]
MPGDDDGADADADADTDLAVRVRSAVADVEDPDLGASVLDAGTVRDLTVEDGEVGVVADLAGADPAAAEETVEAVRRAALSVPGVEAATVERVDGHGGHGPGGGAEDRLPLDGVDRVVAVASAKGGVGKTTVAVGLARALSAAGRDVGLFDADVYGPNVPDLLDVAGPVEATDDGRARPVTADGIGALSVGLVAEDAPVAWRGSMAHEAVTELLGDAAWDCDTLVLDLPPGTGDVVLTTLQSVAVDGAVLVTTPYPTALGDTARSASLFEENGVPVLGAVANMDGFVCEACGHDHDLFPEGDVAEALDLPLLARLPFSSALRDGDPAAFADLATAVAERLDEVDAGAAVPPDALDLRGMPPRARHEAARAEFAALDPGEDFAVVTDHDPRPLLGPLAEAAGRAGPAAFPDPTVRRRGPDAWLLEVTRPPDGDANPDAGADVGVGP